METNFLKGISAAFACLIFGLWGNQDNWMPGHDNNFFGWSFGVAIASVFALIAAGVLFLVEARIQNRKKKYHEEAQRRFERNQETRTWVSRLVCIVIPIICLWHTQFFLWLCSSIFSHVFIFAILSTHLNLSFFFLSMIKRIMFLILVKITYQSIKHDWSWQISSRIRALNPCCY